MVFRRKMQDGQYLGSFASYGYEKDSNDRHKISIDEEAAQIVKNIFSLYLEGYGAHRIANILTERGVSPPSQYKKDKGLNFRNPNSANYSEKYGTWAVNTVRRILRNETYIGTLIQGRERKLSYKSKKVVIAPKDEWVVIKNNHEPIIDEKTFFTVQRLIDNKRTCYRGNDANSESQKSKPHLLAGKVLCLDCGATMQRSGKSRDGVTHYIRCKVSALTKRRDCTPHCISQERIESEVGRRIQALISGTITNMDKNEVIDEIYTQLGNTKDLQAKKQKQLAEVEVKIKMFQRNIAMAYADKLNGIISESDFASYKEVFDEQQQGFYKHRDNLQKQLSDYEIQLKTHENIGMLLEKYKNIDVLTHEVINDFIHTIQIGERNPSTNEQEIIINWLF